ncbi:hypothetical protein HBH98_212940 [Parastagonospora nodorum]|nr:hypothetical protein HBH98_212940 [Parastagonospora nodorum]KAH4361708.1 hypothetical protein HBH97_196290 [Parastagonospora nodorum]KAH4379971.1 hypothetical protein HBH99_197170 [Parastagonospora nodorum]
MLTSLIKELEARHSLLNLSVHDLVEEFTRHKREARLDSLLDSNDYCLDSSLDINSKDNLEDEKAMIVKDLAREQKKRLKALLNAKYSLCKSRDSNRTLHSRRLIGAYILYFKELLSDNSRIFASVIGITKTQAIKNEVVIIDSINSILCDLSNLLVVRFCIFSNSALKNIGILINKKVVEIQTNTATALANKLATINKLIIAEANMPAVHSKATKHYLALLAGQTVFNKFYNCKLESIIIAKFYKDL